ncbi:MAG: hypothetical protein KDD50_04240, partial [Bdellovibrionales bacterium]|nr:hypothetical protein [Bdellovibrionales bacterium]
GNVGLFASLSGAEVSNLTIERIKVVSDGNYLGGLAGYVINSAVDNVHLVGRGTSNADIENTGAVSVNSGGLLGYVDKTSRVSNSNVDLNVEAIGSNVGGLIGYGLGLVDRCSSKGKVTNTAGTIGGFIGSSTGIAVILNSTSESNVYTQGGYAGGFIGQFGGKNIISSVSKGNITGISTSQRVGGFVGALIAKGSVINSYASGDVTGGTSVGGFIGYTSGNSSVYYSLSKGNVTGISPGSDKIGGFIGESLYANLISNFSQGVVAGDTNVGGFAGSFSTSISVVATNNFWNITLNGSLFDVGATGDVAEMSSATTANLSDVTFYQAVSWDFTNDQSDGKDDNWGFSAGSPVAWFEDSSAAAPVFSGGDGSASNPYMISSIAQFEKIVNAKVLNRSFKLANDLDLTSYTWTPLGSVPLPFIGTLDGNGHKVDNLSLNTSLIDNVGLFAVVGFFSEVKNLGLTNVFIQIDRGSSIGALAGQSNGIIRNCYSSTRGLAGADITIVANDNRYNFGGLVGEANNDIFDSYSTVKISINQSNTARSITYVGGLVGITYSSIYRSYTNGDITGNGSDVGGLVGTSYGDIEDSYTLGDVTATNGAGATYWGYKVGGLVGSIWGGYIRNSYTAGNVIGDARVGGIGAYNDYGLVENVYALGNVTADDQVGGLFGLLNGSDLYYSYYNGQVTGNTNTGAVIGMGSTTYGGANIFYNSDLNGALNGVSNTANADVVGKTTLELQDITTFQNANYDFVGSSLDGTADNWKMPPVTGTPLLSWQSL